MNVILLIVILGAVVGRTEGFWGKPPLRDTGPVARVFTGFTRTDDLGTPSKLGYVYIIARHGMVVPVDESYPTDRRFKTKWKKDRFTTHGKRLMTKLGRSLATRYKSFIDASTLQKVKVTTMNTDYAQQNAVELLNGLLPEKYHAYIEKSSMDKSQLLKSPGECTAYASLKSDVITLEQHDTGVLELFEYMNKKMGVTKKTDSRWFVDSNEKVYNLWEILDFEKSSKKWYPWWISYDQGTRIYKIANQYLTDSIFGDINMPKYIAGRIFKEMFDEYEELKIDLHIHVTNDFMYAAFKSLLLDCEVRHPEYGETLMVEVDVNAVTKVHTYRPHKKHDNFKMELKFGEKDSTRGLAAIMVKLRTQYDFDYKLDEDGWKETCRGETLGSLGPFDPLPPASPPQLGTRSDAEIMPPMVTSSYPDSAPLPELPTARSPSKQVTSPVLLHEEEIKGVPLKERDPGRHNAETVGTGRVHWTEMRRGGDTEQIP